MKKLLSIMALFVISLLAVNMVSAATVAKTESTLGGLTLANVTVEVNGEEYSPGNSLITVEEGETLDIEVELDNKLGPDAKGIEVVARLSGYEYSDYVSLEDSTELFDVMKGTKETVDLELVVPQDLENGLNTLRIFVLDRNSNPIMTEFELQVKSARHGLSIKDVTLSPGSNLKAGRTLMATVLIENNGAKTEENVKVTVAVPTLGVQAVEYVDSLSADEREDVFEELVLNIPASAAGTYEALVTVEYDNGRESVTKAFSLNVEASQSPAVDRTVVVVSPDSQSVAPGKTAVYGIALSNDGSASKVYTLTAVTGDWAAASLSDSLVVLAPGQSAVVYVDVAVAADATAGNHLVSVAVKAGSDLLETLTLTADVAESSAADAGNDVNLRNGLEVALIVLVVVLVIVGLIVGFSRLRKDDEEDETYY